MAQTLIADDAVHECNQLILKVWTLLPWKNRNLLVKLLIGVNEGGLKLAMKDLKLFVELAYSV